MFLVLGFRVGYLEGGFGRVARALVNLIVCLVLVLIPNGTTWMIVFAEPPILNVLQWAL